MNFLLVSILHKGKIKHSMNLMNICPLILMNISKEVLATTYLCIYRIHTRFTTPSPSANAHKYSSNIINPRCIVNFVAESPMKHQIVSTKQIKPPKFDSTYLR